ncbi:hypothetical protein A0256_03345 [Mucilaginibacter sp. PAMC 26640]|nr:hypothetical protein A0256_03345 [Mucilaginibacter sp. PAMC 26640]
MYHKSNASEQIYDPLEFAVHSKGRVSLEFIRRVVLALEERFDQSEGSIEFFAFKVEQAALLEDKVWFGNTIEQVTALHEEWAEGFVDQVSKKGGSVCLTLDKANILVSYADNKEDIMIRFDVDRLACLHGSGTYDQAPF